MGVYAASLCGRPHPYASLGPSSFRNPEPCRDERCYRNAHLARERYHAPHPSEGAAPRLLGPGMPGFQSSRHHHTHSHSGHGHNFPSSAPPTHTHFCVDHMRRYASPGSSTASPHMHPSATLRPVSSQSLQRREWDSSRTLPPLVRSRPSTSSHPMYHRSPAGYHSHPHSPAPVMAPINPRQSTSPDRFAHQLPDVHTGQSFTSPPYALEPARWDVPTYEAPARTTPEAWSNASPHPPHHQGPPSAPSRGHGCCCSARRSPPQGTVEPTRTPPPRSPPHASGHSEAEESSPPSRAGRYDPVRGVFIPYPATEPAPAASPSPRAGSVDDKSTCSGGH